MAKVVDIVNFNADASCLSSKWWLKTLDGGSGSYFCKWLQTYIDTEKKVSLGIIGATVADISSRNPEAISLINKHPEIFEIVLRPFAHDIALLRKKESFKYNIEIGQTVLNNEFGGYTNYFLPPEFMLTNEQVEQLNKLGIEGVFINPNRFKKEIKERIPEFPYEIRGIFDGKLPCIPFKGELTKSFLHGIHFFNAKKWNTTLKSSDFEYDFSWRDGESSFFLPDGNIREKAWLENESAEIQRVFLKDAIQHLDITSSKNLLKDKHYRHYPVHSFTAWMKEFRMMGFIQRLFAIEGKFDSFSKLEKSVWLQVINSDILSAIEKDSPRILIQDSPDQNKTVEHTIWRSERGVEGEEFLAILEQQVNMTGIRTLSQNPNQFHLTKLISRIEYIDRLSLLN